MSDEIVSQALRHQLVVELPHDAVESDNDTCGSIFGIEAKIRCLKCLADLVICVPCISKWIRHGTCIDVLDTNRYATLPGPPLAATMRT